MKGQLSALILIAGLILVAGALSGNNLFATFGFTTLSIDQAQFQYSPLVQDDAWVVTVTQGGLGQGLIGGTFSKDEIGQKSGTTPNEDFEVSMDFKKQVCEYNIVQNRNTENVKIFSYREYYSIFDPFCSSKTTALQNCPNLEGNAYGFVSQGGLGCYCIDGVELTGAIANNLPDANVRTIADITVTNSKGSTTGTIDTRGKITDRINDEVYVIYNGDLVTNACDNSYQPTAFYAYSDKSGLWRIGSNDRYKTYLREKISDSKVYGISNADTLKNFVNIANSASRAALIEEPFGSIANPTSLTNAVIEKTPPNVVAKGLYTFIIDADFLKIKQPTPIPQITEVKGTSIKSGGEGFVYVKVRNNGDAGNINTYAVCNSPANARTNSEQSYQSGETKTNYLQVNVNCNQPTTATCNIYAEGLSPLSPTAGPVKANVECSVNQVCTPNTRTCQDIDTIQVCNQDGLVAQEIDCGANQECRYDTLGQAQCVDKSIPPGPIGGGTGGCEWWDLNCIFAGIVAGIQAFFFNLGVVAFIAIILVIVILIIRK